MACLSEERSRSRSSFILTRLLTSTSAASAAACALSKRCLTADCDDIDPYARQCHALHCGHALLRLLSGRDGGEYRWSALW